MTGCLLDTNVIAELANPNGAARVHAWAAAQDEADLFLSVLSSASTTKVSTISQRMIPSAVGLRPRSPRWNCGSPGASSR